MFLTNRSLLALWGAILFLDFFVLVLGVITQEGSQFPGWANLLATIFFFVMLALQTEISRVKSQTPNDEPVQESAKQSGCSQFLGSVVNVAVMAVFIVIFTILNIFLKKITQHIDVFFWAISILISVASMLFTLRSQRLMTVEKRKHIPPTSD